MNPIQKIENTHYKANNKENILSISVSIDGLSFIILDNGKIVFAEAYEWQEKDWSFAAVKVNSILNSREILLESFKKVFCFFHNTDTCLIPNEFYIESESGKALELYLGKSHLDTLTVSLKNAPIKLVFAPNSKIKKNILDKYENAIFLHKYAFDIDKALSDIAHKQVLSLYIGNHGFEIIGVDNKKLIAHNYFQFQTADEFMFLLLSFVKQNGFNTALLILKIYGKLMQDSKLASNIQNYFKNIEFDIPENNKESRFLTLQKYTLLCE